MPSYYAHTDQELLSLMQSGDEQAFVALYDRYRPVVFKYALRICHHREGAEEIVQNVLLKTWQHREQLDPLQNFRGWIARVAAHESFDFLKRLSREQRLKEAVWSRMRQAPAYAEDNYLLKEYLGLVEEAVRSLPRQQQKIYRLSREHYLTYDEIAEQLQISAHTVRNHMSAALGHIRRYLSEHNGGVLPPLVVLSILCIL